MNMANESRKVQVETMLAKAPSVGAVTMGRITRPGEAIPEGFEGLERSQSLVVGWDPEIGDWRYAILVGSELIDGTSASKKDFTSWHMEDAVSHELFSVTGAQLDGLFRHVPLGTRMRIERRKDVEAKRGSMKTYQVDLPPDVRRMADEKHRQEMSILRRANAAAEEQAEAARNAAKTRG
jgi:hypothetical protein